MFSTVEGQLWLLDAQEGLSRLPASVPQPEQAAWSPDGQQLAVGGAGAVVVAPPGALAEAPVVRYQGRLAGLCWRDATTLVFGLLTPEGTSFQLWEVGADGGESPRLVWTCPEPRLRLQSVSPAGDFAWVGFGLVNLDGGAFGQVAGAATVYDLAFSPDGRGWLYASRTVKDLEPHYVLALRPAGSSSGEEQVLLESSKQVDILTWTRGGRVGVLLAHAEQPEIVFLQLAAQR
ncbi:MAG: hypothetical protein ACP5G2_05080 [Candidatus Bipolaricaulaceae bacterium]